MPALAGADDAPRAATDSAGFATLLRQDARSRAGAELAWLHAADAFRFDVHGHYVDPSTGAGGYLQLPITYISSSAADGTDTDVGLGNVEVGGIYVPDMISDLGVVLRAGVTLPTSTGDEDAAANATLLRPLDLAAVIEDGVTVRGSVSTLVRNGDFVARMDVGIDVNVYSATDHDTLTLFDFGLGAGVDLERVALTAELAFAQVLRGGSGNFTTLAFAVRASGLYAALVSPGIGRALEPATYGVLVGFEREL